MQVKNEKYKAFLQGGIMETISRPQFEELLSRVKHRNLAQARALVIIIWMSGKRPNEILNITAGDISKVAKNLSIRIKGSKGGYAGIIQLPMSDVLVNEVWLYSKDKFPDQFLFWAFRSKSKKSSAIRRFRKKQADGTYSLIEKRYEKAYPNLANNLFYWFKKWFELPPYYFRHNRFTRLSEEGASIEEIRQAKGAKGYDSVMQYMHVSTRSAKKTAKLLIK